MIAYNAVLNTSFTSEGTEPVTLQEAKDWALVAVADDDAILTRLITSCRQRLEKFSCVSFIDRTVTARLHNGLGGITLPYGPVGSLTSIVDYNGVTVDTENYDLRGTGFKQLDTDYDNEVTVVYDVTANVTQEMKEDLLNQIAYAYENRGDHSKPKLNPNLQLTYSVLI